MRNSVFSYICALFLAVFTVTLFAKVVPNSYLDGTVLRVERVESQARTSLNNPSDAPMPDPGRFSYNVSVRVNCGTYVGRYENWYDFVPSILAPNQKIRLRLTRNEMFVPTSNAKDNEKEMEMSIVSKHREGGPCEISKK
jgi:hypothetical protein